MAIQRKQPKPKKLTPQMRLGQEAVSMIERVCLQMHCAWSPTGALDVGIDGFIELFDRETGDALGKHLAVQSKAVTTLPQETDSTFAYSCDARDLQYWKQGNMPVLLIVSQPDSDSMYWVSIKDYFADPDHTTNTVHFDKVRNRFSTNTYSDLVRLGRDEGDGLYLGPIPQPETLVSNLLPVTRFPERIWVGESRFSNVKQIYPILNASANHIGGDWILKGGSILSFQNLQERPWSNICDQGTCEDFSIDEWSESSDPERQRHFVELLNRSLTSQLYPAVRYRNDQRCYAFHGDLASAPIKVRYQSLANQVSLTVVSQYENSGADGKDYTWLRHLAFRGQFQRFDGAWFLEITPTYVFTWDGIRLYRFHEEALKGIKQLEKNRAVLSALLLWADHLKAESGDLFKQPILQFGDLSRFELPVGIDDDGWMAIEPGDASPEDDEVVDLFSAIDTEESP